MADTVVAQIRFEIGQIDQLLTIYDDLLSRAQLSKPDLVETTAVASVLHSFYNGLENIFLSIAKRLDRQVPAGPQSHRDLLVQMTRQTSTRVGAISIELAQQLAAYLAFRHFYRHSYSFTLDWSELEKLVVPLQQVWADARQELYMFLDSLSSPTPDETR